MNAQTEISLFCFYFLKSTCRSNKKIWRQLSLEGCFCFCCRCTSKFERWLVNVVLAIQHIALVALFCLKATWFNILCLVTDKTNCVHVVAGLPVPVSNDGVHLYINASKAYTYGFAIVHTNKSVTDGEKWLIICTAFKYDKYSHMCWQRISKQIFHLLIKVLKSNSTLRTEFEKSKMIPNNPLLFM